MPANATALDGEITAAIEAYARGTRSAYATLMVLTVFTTLLLPFFVALFHFSSAPQRTSPMFVCVVLSVVATIASNVTQLSFVFKGLYHPFAFVSSPISKPVTVFAIVLGWLPNFLADVALLYRMLAAYPLSITSRTRLLSILLAPLLIKLVRVASFLVVISLLVKTSESFSSPFNREQQIWIIVERTCAALDNGYATVFFLWKMRSTFWSSSQTMSWAGGAEATDSLLGRIKTLCWLAATNFVIPFPLCLLQLVFTVAAPTTQAFYVIQDVVNFASVTCVAFATVWSLNNSARRPSDIRIDLMSSSRVKTPTTALSPRRETRRFKPEAESIQLKSLDRSLQTRAESPT